MAAHSDHTTPFAANLAHLQRLFMLRNIAILAQFSTVLVVYFFLKIEIPVVALGLVILQVVFFNVYTALRLRHTKPISHNEIFIHLLFDVLALAILLYFTGGATNPFIILFLFPLTIAVTILPARYSWILAVLAIGCYSLLMVKYQALPIEHNMHAQHQDMNREYDLHIIGMWLGFIVSAALITYFVFGMGNTLRRQQQLLADAREKALRDEQLVTLGTLAASTAHELGTPLGTMSLLAAEIKAELSDAPDMVINDIDQLKQQINRCKSALAELSAATGASPLQGGESITVIDYLDQLLEQLEVNHTDLKIKTDWQDDLLAASILADRTLDQALMNILDNAIEVSPNDVQWCAKWDDHELIMQVCDRGPGLSLEARELLGKSPYTDKHEGLGLGLFLAHAIIKRYGGDISQYNREEGGSCTQITLPLLS